jgi:hypothetical protein
MIRTLTRKFSKLSRGKDIFYPKYGNSFYEYSNKDIKIKKENSPTPKIKKKLKIYNAETSNTLHAWEKDI